MTVQLSETGMENNEDLLNPVFIGDWRLLETSQNGKINGNKNNKKPPFY